MIASKHPGIAAGKSLFGYVTEGRGPAAVQAAYLDTFNGRVPPNLGHMLSLAWRFDHTPAYDRYLLTPFLPSPEWV